ncbi:hypothetical protein N7453_010991 [Penicillium expansum]|nr:hypothetical protein N7453_010991 [Penicillium expansum]
MAESGNDVGLNVWIDHLVKEGEMNPRVLKRAMTKAGMHGQTEVMELARERFEIMHGKPEWLSHVLAQAIRYGSLDAIKYLFRHF